MGKNEFEGIKRQVCTKIDYLYEALCASIPSIKAESLLQSKISINSSPFVYQNERINCSIEDIILTIPSSEIRHLYRSDEKNIDNVELRLSLNGCINANTWKDKDKNPWETLTLKTKLIVLTMTGMYTRNFHVDLIEDNENIYQEVHPLSHIHFHGTSDNCEKNVEIDVPRLVHFPLDMVLGLSVALRNYLPAAYEKLKNNPIYLGLCYESQKRLLVPYFNVYRNGIGVDGKANKTIQKVCPYLV